MVTLTLEGVKSLCPGGRTRGRLALCQGGDGVVKKDIIDIDVTPGNVRQVAATGQRLGGEDEQRPRNHGLAHLPQQTLVGSPVPDPESAASSRRR